MTTATYPPLTSFRITYQDGTSYVTSCAAGITLDEAKKYFMQAPRIMADEVTQKVVVNVEKLS